MKKLLLFLLLISGLASSSQVTVFEDGFDTYTNFAITGFGNWQTIDVDGLNTYGVGTDFTWLNNGVPQAFMIFNPSATTPPVTNSTTGVNGETENRNFTPRSGAKYAACWNAALDGGSPVNNDWLVSPVINLGTSNSELRFWVKALSDSYGVEKYRVYVYQGTGTPVPADFTQISGIAALNPPYGTWQEKIFSLSAYNGLPIRIAIRCVSTDNYMFMVDDFKVTSSNLKTDEFLSNKFSMYPNPANDIITIANSESILVSDIRITDINGRTVKSINANNVSELQVNVSDLTSGVYFMNINSESGTAVKKFVKN